MCAPIPKNKWSWKYDRCVECGTTGKKGKHIHKGRGLCNSCWDKERAKNPKMIAYSLVNRRKWQKKFKELPNYKELQNLHQKEWRTKYPKHYKALWHRVNLKLKFARFIKSPVQHKYKKYQNTLKFICEDCGEMIQTCILPKKGNSEIINQRVIRELKLFKKVHKKFCKGIKK